MFAKCRIWLQKTVKSTGENQSSSDTGERPDDEGHGQVSSARATVLCVRFIARRYCPGVWDSGKDEEEMDTDQAPGPTATSDVAAADDDDNDDDVGTPEQVDWIVVTSHADNTIRFRNAEASYCCIV